MFSFFKALIGGSAYSKDPIATGVIHLRQQIKREGLKSDEYPDSLLRELSEYSHRFAQNMAEISPQDKPVTYFVDCLEACAINLYKSSTGEIPEVASPVHDIFYRYGIRSKPL